MSSAFVEHIVLPHWLRIPAAEKVFLMIRNAGGEARFVGGCVRDALMGIEGGGDIDMATTLLPDQVIRAALACGIRAVPTGIDHGTVSLVIDAVPIEITTLRRDEACDGRHADVAYTEHWEEDAARRDFTINAMSLDEHGTLFDYFGGRADLREGRLRFVGDAEARIQEDYLRILRFFRFFARFGRERPTEDVAAALRGYRTGLEKVSVERTTQEMWKLLAAPLPQDALELMQETRVLREILPEDWDMPDLSLVSYLMAAERRWQVVGDRAARRMAALVVMTGEAAQWPEMVQALAVKWKLSRVQRRSLERYLSSESLLPFMANQATQQKHIRLLGKQDYTEVLTLSFALSLWRYPERQPAVTEFFDAAKRYAETWVVPRFPLVGRDIMAMGVQEGKEIGQWLRLAEKRWVDSHYSIPKHDLLVFLQTEINQIRGEGAPNFAEES